jgi:hypothetical protein
MSELLNCPFCQRAPRIADLCGWEVICECGVLYSLEGPEDCADREKTIAAWNTRSPVEGAVDPEEVMEALEEIEDALKNFNAECCNSSMPIVATRRHLRTVRAALLANPPVAVPVVDEIALRAAKDIAKGWGDDDRPQVVAQIQVRVISAIRESLSTATKVES